MAEKAISNRADEVARAIQTGVHAQLVAGGIEGMSLDVLFPGAAGQRTVLGITGKVNVDMLAHHICRQLDEGGR